MFVYKRSEPNLWTVGHYSPDGEWHPESDHDNTNDAANRVHWLNGGMDHLTADITNLYKFTQELQDKIQELSAALESVYFNSK